ncbi:uncharacterized protein C8A04DRAFT_15031 [Dichotomopilus funicola]|uniref:DUF7582 domain-containing protein n=1 Tax=Dichotomopilus funicola TaxID=1934379 RepID=A0AAN6UWD4_9PEZI|nr:hypothetical protein C8A04DRAFT_15031 [Dichotomopilus funicola]
MSSSPCLRTRISSPLEAGPSIANGHHLPGNVTEALEYASKRLRRKAAHIKLLVVRRDYQIPTSPTFSTFTPGPLPVSAVSTPSRTVFPPVSRIEALKQLIRPSNPSGEGQIRERIVHAHLDQLRNGTASPAFSEASAFSASTVSSASTTDSTFSQQRSRWPGSPTPYGSVPVTPATPFTIMSSLSGSEASNMTHFGTKLVYAHPLSPREEKSLSQALEKAAKKFKLDPSWLPQAVSPSTLGLPVDLVLKSTTQNEVLFTSEHLTLLSLDHLYTFRAALQAYARSKAVCRLEDAVDELRRLFLANGRRAVRKSALLAAFRWLDPLNDAALADVCRMYERAYGGIERENGVENDVDPTPGWPLCDTKRSSGNTEGSLGSRTKTPTPTPGSISRSLAREATPPSQDEEPEPELQVLDLTNALDKELLLSSHDLHPDDRSDLDDIEAWYREIELQQEDNSPTPEIEISITPSEAPEIVEIPPPPCTPPPPPPTSATYRNRPWHQPEEPSLSEMLRTTPRLRPPPPGRSLALKLQTTFEKPTAVGKKELLGVGKQQGSQAGNKGQDEEEEEEELTARPRSAIKSFSNARWTVAHGNGSAAATIDEMLHGGASSSSTSLDQSQNQSPEERVGPMTPNGYDDISPITRGEWGFLMFGKGKTGGVEMC